MCINWSRIQTINNIAAKKMEKLTWSATHEGAHLNSPGVCWGGVVPGISIPLRTLLPEQHSWNSQQSPCTSRRPHTVQYRTAQHSVSAGRSLWAVLTRAWWLDLHAGLRSARHTVGAEGFTKLNNIFLNKEKLNLKCPEVAAEEARYSSEERDVTGRTELVIWS